MESNYILRAEFMIARGYVEELSVEALADKLRRIEEAKIKPPTDVLTREMVYGESAELIKKIADSKDEHQKKLITPGERESAYIKSKR